MFLHKLFFRRSSRTCWHASIKNIFFREPHRQTRYAFMNPCARDIQHITSFEPSCQGRIARNLFYPPARDIWQTTPFYPCARDIWYAAISLNPCARDIQHVTLSRKDSDIQSSYPTLVLGMYSTLSLLTLVLGTYSTQFLIGKTPISDRLILPFNPSARDIQHAISFNPCVRDI